MGGIYDSWRLTPGAGAQYLQTPDRVVIDAVYRASLSQREPVSNTAVVAEAGTNAHTVAPWVVFVCGERHYGVPLDCVSEILTPRPFTRLPGAGADVCGLVGVRGRVVTVFDFGVVLGLGRAADRPDHRLLLLDLGARRIGAAVEDIVIIAPARVDALEMGGGIVGTGVTPDTEFTALDPRKLLLGRLLAA